jgi:hypothetical protein
LRTGCSGPTIETVTLFLALRAADKGMDEFWADIEQLVGELWAGDERDHSMAVVRDFHARAVGLLRLTKEFVMG